MPIFDTSDILVSALTSSISSTLSGSTVIQLTTTSSVFAVSGSSGSYLSITNNPSSATLLSVAPFNSASVLTVTTSSVNISASAGTTITASSFVYTAGSNIEIQANNTGVTLGNAIGDNHSITGSLRITGSQVVIVGQVSASLFSGSFVGSGAGLSGIVASANPAGPNQSIQFNDNGATSGSGDFTFNKTNNSVSLTGTVSASVFSRALYYRDLTVTDSTNQNDYSPTGWNDADPNKATAICISGSASIKITGLAGGTDGRVAIIENQSSDHIIILEDDSASSLAANRFNFRNPVFLLPNGSITLLYDTTHQKWEPIGSSGGIGFGAFFNEFEDFGGTVGRFGTTVAGTGASAQISTYLFNTTLKPLGAWQIDTGTTATGRAHLGYTQATSVVPANGQAIMLTRLAVEALSNATDRYQIFAGWHDAVGATNVTDGVYWLYDDAASTAWQGATARASTRTTTGAAGPTVDTNYIWLGIFVNSTWTRATYFYSTDSITWVIAGSQTTNLPLAANQTGFGVTINKTASNTQRNCSIDLLAHRYDITRG